MNSIFKTFFLSLCIIANTSFVFAQNAAILPPAKTTFLDSNGKPLTGGKVNFYIPSTTTPKTTWQDQAATIPNANPVVLDSAGRAIILGSGNYRQVVYDKYGNLIWDQVTSSNGTGGGSTPTSVGDGSQVGTIREWAGFTAPTNYLFAYGEAVSRATYSTLFTAITSTQPVFCNAGNPQLTGLTDTTNFWIGMSVEVSCLASGSSTVVSKTSTTVNLAANANVTTNTNATFFPWGNGNASSTFNLPDLRGYVLAGNNNMGGAANSVLTTTYFGATNPNSIGAAGGSQSSTLATANLPAYTPAGTITNGAITSTFSSPQAGLGPAGGSQAFTSGSAASTAVSGTVTSTQATSTFTGTAQGGTDTAFSLIQPTKTINYIIKVIPDTNLSVSGVVTSIGGLSGAFTCVSPVVCAGNTITSTGGGGGGGVSTVSVATANGLAGTVTNPTSTPNITLSTTVSGLVKANAGAFSGATAGIDYQSPISLTTLGTSGAATLSGSTLNIPQYTEGGGGSGTAFKQNFIAGVGFTTGSTTSLTLSTTPTTGQAVLISFDGVDQIGGTGTTGDTWTISGAVITFNAAITAVNVVQVVGLSSSGGGGTGTVTSASVVTANGFYGSVATATTTPAITLNTNVSGIMKGTGSAMTAATAGTDYQAPVSLTTFGSSGAATFSGTTLNIPNYSTGGGTSYRGILVDAVAETTYCNTSGHPIDPTGANDSTAGINACLTKYLSVGLREGHYAISGSGIQMTQNNMMLIGVGPGYYYQATNTFYPGGTTLYQTTASGPVIFNNGGSQSNIIQGMLIERTVAATSGGDGIAYNTANAVNNHILRDLIVNDQYNGITLGGAYLALIDNVQANFNYNNGIQILGTVATPGQWNLVNVASGQNNGWGFFTYNSTANSYMNMNEWLNITTFANCSGGMDFKGNASGGTVDTIRIVNYNGSGSGASDVVFETYGEHNYLMSALIEGAGSGGNSSGGLGYCGRGTIGRTTPASGIGYGVILQTSNQEVTVSGADIRLSANSGIATTGLLGAFTATNNHLTSNNCQYSSGCLAHTAGDSGIYISFSGIAAGASQTSVVLNGNNSYGAGTQVYGVYNANGSTSTTTMTGNSFAGSSIGCGGATVTKAGNIQNLGSAC